MITPEIQMDIEKRTIEEISTENKQLLDKIKKNSIVLHIKKLNEKAEKEKEKMEKTLPKARKTFAFHIISKDTVNMENIKKFCEEFWKKLGKNIAKFIMINNFIYIKSKENVVITDRELGITDSCKLVQVYPKDIIKLQ